MSKEPVERRSNVSCILAVGGGALVGIIIGFPYYTSKNAIGLLWPIIGAAVGGLLYRFWPVGAAMEPDEPDDPSPNCRVAKETSMLPTAIAFLIVGPVFGGFIGCFIGDGESFPAVLMLGAIAGIVGFVGCLCAGSSK